MARKIALAGIGKIARDQHVPSIAASGDWELAATITRHEGVEGIENYTDIDAMLAACPDIDVISLCLPPVPRFEYAAAAIRAGRHVMLEKPPGATLAECHTLEAMAREAGVSIFATWHSREAASVEAARKWLADKTLKRLKITLARGCPPLASRTGVDLGTGWPWGLRPRHQCALDPHPHPPGTRPSAECDAQVP